MMGGCSDQLAYRVIRQLNCELEKNGVITVRGKGSRQYLVERFFGAAEAKGGQECQ